MNFEVEYDEIVESARELNDKLRYDVLICHVREDIEVILKETLNRMIERGIFKNCDETTQEEKLAKRTARNFGFDSESEEDRDDIFRPRNCSKKLAMNNRNQNLSEVVRIAKF